MLGGRAADHDRVRARRRLRAELTRQATDVLDAGVRGGSHGEERGMAVAADVQLADLRVVAQGSLRILVQILVVSQLQVLCAG